MKNLIKLSMFSLFCILLLGSCNKDEVTTNTDESRMVWVTPTGKVIPAAERHNWANYVYENFKVETTSKARPKFYGSRSCTTPTTNCGLECVKIVSGDADCNKESACAPCMNCC